ncbi:hypothetical protein LR48_Vigan03g140000 [Vigna angularis]|uniref:Uncharacterized protein n=1 Tax=Phaseolus angularis TaxID=3914 RepID=A0A0L9U5B8_PHAAN|nr:hypothetical protein LR48_Vigan03g140000 [Vigna angularis]
MGDSITGEGWSSRPSRTGSRRGSFRSIPHLQEDSAVPILDRDEECGNRVCRLVLSLPAAQVLNLHHKGFYNRCQFPRRFRKTSAWIS